MAATAAFPTIHDVLIAGNNLYGDKEANGTIKAGMVVGFAATGVSGEVGFALSATGTAFGVACHDASDGDKLLIAGPGCIATVAEGDGTAIDAGDWLMVSNEDGTGDAEGGFVKVLDPAIGAHAATHPATAATQVIGMAWEDIAANGTGPMLILPSPLPTASS